MTPASTLTNAPTLDPAPAQFTLQLLGRKREQGFESRKWEESPQKSTKKVLKLKSAKKVDNDTSQHSD